MTGTVDVEDVLSKLNNVEKVALLAGADWWHTIPIKRLGIPAIRMSDGPNGVRGTKFFNGVKAACFPCGTGLGATWDVDLLRQAGQLMGDESKSKGSHIILGPTINMQRSPLGGRGFESLSEDPVLAGLGAAALVNGIQDKDIAATIKHFVCNDLEHERNGTNAIITDRALREIYCLPFQLVVKDSKPACFMTAYNKVNGIHVSENDKILKGILRGEWGWEGMVMSDWWGTYSTSEAINAGLDLEMAGPTRWRGMALQQAVSVGKVHQHVLDERVRNVLNLINRVSAAKIEEYAPELTADTPETAAFLRKIGGESIVLMKNEDKILPLSKDKKTLILGPNAKYAAIHGGGSAALAAYYAVTPFEGIKSQLTSDPLYTVGCYSHKELPLIGDILKTANGETGISFKAYNEAPNVPDREIADELVLTKTELLMMDYNCSKLKSDLWYGTIEGTYTAEEDCDFEFSLGVYGAAKLFVDDKLLIDNDTVQRKGTMFFNCGTAEEKGTIPVKKGQAYQIRVEFSSAPTSKLDPGSNTLFGSGAVRIGGAKVIDAEEEIKHAAALAKNTDQVIICAGLNSDWESEGNDRDNMALPGYMDALITAVTAANPSTVVVMQSGTPVEMPWISSTKAMIHAWYGGNETGNAIADVLFGKVNPSAKLPLSFPKRLQDNPAFLSYKTERGRVLYSEDVYVGYRWYEMLDLPVLFPFGHGLSYTTFEISELAISKSDASLKVSVKVSNTGDLPGAEVIQVYVSQKNPSIKRPKKELKGFKKVYLEKGESTTVEVEIETKYATSFWDEVRDSWIIEKDTYDVLVGSTSEKIQVKGEFEVGKTSWWKGL
ncbi:(Trans)glycosidase [Glarea lozoyensis ATCC 20868]|uniref:beta-glucosidase n=1 Tax=Glarea lozoyensis (strain ATCC 20868 / MF5171) TaxID=1116229 RepID=S3CZQ6_GLAL2|nr:(Trans)glycosidase [Glarea lozoyensis ATCC 20868]EPE30379.1 (Trans)glycosidase [Glarea lozoyensis ATCC 20868]